MKLLTTLLVGAAVAGVIYYIVDREGAEELLGEVKGAAQDAYDKMNEGLAGVKSKVSETLG
jgi:dsDNA-binding SOS-regulon protein